MREMKFTKTHEWVLIDADIATVGITDYAQKELGDIVFVELPSVGGATVQGNQCITVESTKAAAEVYAPLSGEIVAVNSDLQDKPQLVNESPFERGWMIKIKIQDVAQLSCLLDKDAYDAFAAEESH